jgi:hypothetical protein
MIRPKLSWWIVTQEFRCLCNIEIIDVLHLHYLQTDKGKSDNSKLSLKLFKYKPVHYPENWFSCSNVSEETKKPRSGWTKQRLIDWLTPKTLPPHFPSVDEMPNYRNAELLQFCELKFGFQFIAVDLSLQRSLCADFLSSSADSIVATWQRDICLCLDWTLSENIRRRAAPYPARTQGGQNLCWEKHFGAQTAY